MKAEQTISAKESGQRLDIYCRSILHPLSRAAIQKAIKAGHITINGQQVKPRQVLHEEDRLDISLPDTKEPGEKPDFDELKLPTLYEDKDVVVVDKPAGILVHATAVSVEPTVASWFAAKYAYAARALSSQGERAGIVHRLDRNTSGVLILAKTPEAFHQLKNEFKKRHAKKEYLALVHGTPNADDGRINQAITRSPRNPSRRTIDESGKPAITEWKVEQQYPNFTLARLFPYTGRTHQLRVHMHFIGHPVVGDPLYTFKRLKSPPGADRQLLHAASLTLRLPNKKRRTFTADLPEDFQTVIEHLKQSSTMSQSADHQLGYRTPSSFQANASNERS